MKKTSVFLIVLLMALVSIGSCQQEDKKVENSHTEFLMINHPIEFDKLTLGERNILGEAFSRLDILQDLNGKLRIKQSSGAEVNLSDSIFAYFKSIIESSNEDLKRVMDIKTRELSMDSDGYDNVQNDSGDCVIYSIEANLKSLGKSGCSVDDIKKKLRECGLYDENGVTYSNMLPALNCYFNAVECAMPEEISLTSSFRYVAIEVLHNPDGTINYHSETLLAVTNGVYWSHDDQNGNERVLTANDFLACYCLRRK